MKPPKPYRLDNQAGVLHFLKTGKKPTQAERWPTQEQRWPERPARLPSQVPQQWPRQ